MIEKCRWKYKKFILGIPYYKASCQKKYIAVTDIDEYNFCYRCGKEVEGIEA